MKVNRRLLGAALTSAFVIAACGGGAATQAPTTRPAASPTATSPAAGATGGPAATIPTGIAGNLDVHGSSTVAPISQAVAEDLQAANPELGFLVGDEGTGAGFEEFFCVGQSDVADASRPIRAADPATDDVEEAELCEQNQVDYVELKVAYDGLAVITSVNNRIECLTFADLYGLLGPEAESVVNWNDAEPVAHELGSTTDLPDAPLSVTAPGDESGTYDSFVELVFGDILEERFSEDEVEANERLRTPGNIYVASANDNAIIQGVSGFDTSLGFVGLKYAEENASAVKILGVDAGEGCVVPSTETVSDGSYPISRPLFIYPNLGRAATNAALVAYVDFYLSDAGIANAADVGYVPLPAEELEATRAAWEDAKP